MTPNRFLAVVDEEECTGCEVCIDRCPFEAIEMKTDEATGEQKSSINAERCKGCGLCIITCESNALTYEIVRSPEYLKPKPPEGGKAEEVHVVPVWGQYFLK